MELQEAAGAVMLFQLIIFLGFMLFGMCALSFSVWMLIDCLKNEKDEENQKLVWTLVIVFTNWIGAIIYFFVRRKKRKQNESLGMSPQHSTTNRPGLV